MSGPSLDEYRTRLREALGVIKQLQSELQQVDQTKSEPIAIVGMACRLPGGIGDPDALWRALREGVDVVREIERWPEDAIPGAKQGVRWAGLLDDIETFDPGFFGISPREAERLDPQQRLLLEVAWEALEDAGQRPDRLLGSRTGVFIGLTTLDYQERVKALGAGAVDAYCLTGNLSCTAAGRLSFVLGLQGPCISTDTACSSSLVSVHLACHSLRTGESDLAIAGGVNVILSPSVMAMLAETRALSPDGRCKTFDASANGYVRSEGCGILVLKRLSDAQRDGDRIWALIRGSAVNQDGRSTGLTTPNVLAQEAVLTQALANARVLPEEIGYVEAHGTGTSLGDPIEMDALAKVFGRPTGGGAPLVVGALKTNLGHLEATAGVAGLIKTTLILNHGVIPRNNHFRTLNPRIVLDRTRITVAAEDRVWPRGNVPRRGGVSSFGISGTNAHVILEEPPVEEARAAGREASAYLLPLSAKSREGLVAMARSYGEWLTQTNDVSLADMVYTASVRRTHHAHRLSVVGGTREELGKRLSSYARGEAPAGVVQGRTSAEGRPKVVFVFPGQGSQWLGMGRTLWEEERAFGAALKECDAAIREEAGFSVVEELFAEEGRSRLAEIDVVQPVLFAIEVALAALWRAWGVEPDCVVGHSMGEVAAAHVAGVLTLGDAAKVICRRSRLLRRISGKGAMGLVELPMPEAEAAIAGYERVLGVAVSNGPRSTVLSGDPGALEEVLGALEKRGVFCRRVKVDVASHSPQVEPLREELLAALRDVRPGEARTAMRSTVTEGALKGGEATASYWWDNLREPVRFSQVARALMNEGHALFVEMSPHPILLPSVEENLEEAKVEGAAIASLRRHAKEVESMLEALGALHARGYPVDFTKRFPDGGRVVALPRYAWQRERFWVETPSSPRAVRGQGVHALLGAGIVPASQPEMHLWEQWISTDALPYLADHEVQGEVVFPGAGYVEMALAAAASVYGEGAARIDALEFERMLALPRGGERLVQVSVVEEGGGRATLSVSSRPEGSKEWVRHAKGGLRVEAAPAQAPAMDSLDDVEKRCPEVVEKATHYRQMEARSLSYGESFQGVQRLRIGKDEVVARVQLPEAAGANVGDYLVHPALLDACFQAAGPSLRSLMGEGTFVPVEVSSVRVYERPGREVWVHGRVVREPGQVDPVLSLVIRNGAGRAVVEVGALRLQRLVEADNPSQDPFADCVFELSWQRKDAVEGVEPPAGAWLVFADGHGFGATLAERLRARGDTCVEVRAGEGYARTSERQYSLDPQNLAQWQRLLGEALGKSACRGVIHCASLDGARFGETTEATLEADLRRGASSLLRLAQAILRQGWRDIPRLHVLTRAAQAAGTGTGSLSFAQSAVWGLGRVIAMEQPDLGCARIDLPPEALANEVDLVMRELFAGGDEDQVALRPEGRYVARLVRGRLGNEASEKQEPAAGRPYRLESREPGVLDRLCLRPMDRRPPGPGEVEIEVEAAGLNFLDVLLALGALPDDVAGNRERGPRLGVECAGRIVALGDGVLDLALGQEVIALSSSAMATHVTAKRLLVAPKPASLGWEEAAAMPVVALTAYYSLAHVARLRKGERVLIHAGAGGVGMAAIQWARHVGAEIFATAGSEPKRALLRAMGVHHVMDSRSLSFVADVERITKGEGVDVVLNSLSGEFIQASLGLLRDHGRFVEIGKRDYYENRPLGSRPFLKNLSFSLVDLRGMMFNRPEVVASLLEELAPLLASGVVGRIPFQAFPASKAADAFAWMAQGKHTGKLVLSMRDPDARLSVPVRRGGAAPRSDGTYLITGGLGGLGSSLAEWLVERGARHVALMGRGAPSEAARRAIEKMQEAGADVRVLRGDVSRRADVDAAIAEIEREMRPIRGVVHAAAVLDDRTVVEMTEEQFWNPCAPKVFGGWNLHEATRGRDLDFFVAYSAAAGLLGSPGQANYAAANTALDGLCQARAAEGLPGTSIQWGPFAEVGLAAAEAIRGKRIASRGTESFKPAEGNELFGRVLGRPRPEVALMRLHVRQWVEFYPQMAGAPFLSELTEGNGTSAVRGGKEGMFRDVVLAAAPHARAGLLEAHLAEQLGRVLRLDPGRIDKRAPFTSLGMDSLLSLELRNRLEASLGLKLSAALLFTHATTVALAVHLLDRLVPPVAPTGEGAAAQVSGEARDEGPAEDTPLDDSDESALLDKLESLEEYLR
ncbi:type I polyketide synthase [Polyangium sp. 6x1]|uniref:SDR family NAD(P)-dependent oxidoreductase n=1 Tax=Polyangium sp. 6x1 TaxID=3042689 RepID=UPI002482F01F|nr:type I polyketide synthase [Polyangium sp. 6x1]MDI1443200.1 type I polyketide synthase [Polyangium sp. 6x1]